MAAIRRSDRKSTRLNSTHTEIYTLSLHDALPISLVLGNYMLGGSGLKSRLMARIRIKDGLSYGGNSQIRSEEHTSELHSHRDLHSFPTRRSSDLAGARQLHAGRKRSQVTPDGAHPHQGWPELWRQFAD